MMGQDDRWLAGGSMYVAEAMTAGGRRVMAGDDAMSGKLASTMRAGNGRQRRRAMGGAKLLTGAGGRVVMSMQVKEGDDGQMSGDKATMSTLGA